MSLLDKFFHKITTEAGKTGKPWQGQKVKKGFPYKAVPARGGWQMTAYDQSRYAPPRDAYFERAAWEVRIYIDVEALFPSVEDTERLKQAFWFFDWHSAAAGGLDVEAGEAEGFVGWAHGVETNNILWMLEVQSDIMQNTFALYDKVKLNADKLAALAEIQNEIESLDAELSTADGEESNAIEDAITKLKKKMTAVDSSFSTKLDKRKHAEDHWSKPFEVPQFDDFR